ncbi:hypothetical protein [Kribbella catacumbae]|uniref:hypothetical protein n=1 Tax=Kribbella catacumbae TaxID=460086 RepID=UPI00037AB0F3|nr:hypothetical protein [Kribbella catacumbae]
MGLVQTFEPGDFTLADLDALPDDGTRYEIVDGMLLVTAIPLPIHQTRLSRSSWNLRWRSPT